jgi:hypothetical protein
MRKLLVMFFFGFSGLLIFLTPCLIDEIKENYRCWVRKRPRIGWGKFLPPVMREQHKILKVYNYKHKKFKKKLRVLTKVYIQTGDRYGILILNIKNKLDFLSEN